MINKYTKKVNKMSKKFNRITKGIFSDWGKYVDNAKWNSYKNLEYNSISNLEFDKNSIIEISNMVIFDIPHIYQMNNIEEIDLKKIDKCEVSIYKCLFNMRSETRPFRKVNSLDNIKENIKNFPNLYRQICNVFIENEKMIYLRYKEAKSYNIDKDKLKKYKKHLRDYKVYNEKLDLEDLKDAQRDFKGWLKSNGIKKSQFSETA